MPEELFFSELMQEKWDFLDELEVTDKEIKKIHRLETGSAFYLGRIFERMEKPDTAERFYRMEYERGTGIWRIHAGHRLMGILMDNERWEEAEEHALDMLKTVLDTRLVLRNLAETYYMQEKYQLFLDTLQRIQERDEENGDAELFLMYAVSLRETGKTGWVDSVKKVFTAYPASEVHTRLYLYLEYHGLLRVYFTEIEREVFRWKYHEGAGEAEKGAEIIGNVLDRYIGEPALIGLLGGKVNVDDLEMTFRISGNALEGVTALRHLQQEFAGGKEAPVYLLHALGRLSLYSGDNTAAEKYFLEAMALSNTEAEYDRELWYMLYAVFCDSPERMLPLFVQYSETWNNRVYFTDIIEDVCAYLLRTGKWNEFKVLTEEISGNIDKLSADRMAFCIGMAQKYGFLEEPSGEGCVWKGTDSETDYYYALRKGNPLYELDRSVKREPGEEESQVEKYILGHLTYGLYTEAMEEAEKYLEELSAGVLRQLIARLSGQGYYREGILLFGGLKENYPLEIEREDLQYIYPRGFIEQIQETADREGIPEHLLNALIRVESAFDPAISSHAGAVGLTQLMPSTAYEVAGKMGLEEVDLTDPGFSISAGARYFVEMYERFGNYIYALCAYNAGPGRMRSWLKSFGHLPPVLFLEALPFRETREYGRDVLVMTAYYQYLYENRPIRESIGFFFPDLYGNTQ